MRTILSFLYRSNRSVCFSAAVLLSMLTVTGALSASTTPQIAAGGYHSIALKQMVLSWCGGIITMGNWEMELTRIVKLLQYK